MGNTCFKCRIKPYIQPFERDLALAELKALTGSEPEALPTLELEPYEFAVNSDVPADLLASRLSYWESVNAGDKWHLTTQVLREATVNTIRNGIRPEEISKVVPFEQNVPLPNRRCLRYGTHGIHEYRGKFFPQLVKSLINVINVPPDGLVADPMSGSGTTLVEAVLGDYQGLGLDINPMSVLMGRTKCALLFVEPQEIISTYKRVIQEVSEEKYLSKTKLYFPCLPEKDQKYLQAWFSEDVLLKLDMIMQVIQAEKQPVIQDLLRLALSNIIRSVSWQKNDDLRVRKEITSTNSIDPVKSFLEELERSVKSVLAFLYQNQNVPLGDFIIGEGDARYPTRYWQQWQGSVDVIITSPPYATALPYLDTDRLSLCYLGLLSRPQHRQRDQEMIGNREVTDRIRKQYWDIFQNTKGNLPNSVVELIEKIEQLNSQIDVGFRRKNLPSLLAKYFLDMKDVFIGMHKMLKANAKAFVVIGNNHTIAGGERVDIETASLLEDIAETVGFEIEQSIPMEMLVSRDIFKKNAVTSEYILSLRRSTYG